MKLCVSGHLFTIARLDDSIFPVEDDKIPALQGQKLRYPCIGIARETAVDGAAVHQVANRFRSQ